MEVLSSKIVKKADRPIKILQVGEGNFLRGFFDYFIQVLNDKTDFDGNIAMVQPRNSHKISRFYKQDLLYTVITEGIKDGQLVSYSDVIDVIGEAIDPYENYKKFLAYAKSKDLQVIVSNTTENGIVFDESDTNLDSTPTSYPAKLLAFLKKRYEYFNGSKEAGLYIIPTELITMNGDQLQDVLMRLAKLNNLEQDFIDWMFDANKFYCTLVDRIIPGYPKDDIEKWQDKWGYIDNLAVKGEVYHLFAIQGDKSLLDVLPFDKTDLNVIVTENVTPYKELKVKILNGSHTFMLPTVYQLGFRVVNKTVNDTEIHKLLNGFVDTEVMPSINLPKEEIIAFKESVFERFANPTIQHMWTSIMLNSMSKYKERILPVVKHFYESTGDIPKYSLFALASLFTLYKLNAEQNNKLFSDEPQFLDMWSQLFDGAHSNEEIINHVLNLDFWGFDFSKIPGAKNYILKCFDDIINDGMQSPSFYCTKYKMG